MAGNTPAPWTARDRAAAALVAVTALVAYLPALGLSFTSDDFFILDRVKALGGLHDPLAYFRLGFFEYYRPLAFLSHALDWTLWGPRGVGFHLTNILVHAITTVFVFAIGRRLIDRPAAVIAALLFALHPASQEAVYWIAARFDLLATCFMLAALICLWHEGTAAYVCGVACFALALLSKESALSLPVIATAADVLLVRRNWRSAALRLFPFLVVVAVYALLRAHGVDVSVTGGARRLPKLAMIVAALGGLLLLARVRKGTAIVPILPGRKVGFVLGATMGVALIAAVLLLTPATAVWTREKLGFVAFASFYLASPVVLPPPHPWFLDVTTMVYAIAGVVAVVAIAAVAFRGSGWITREPRMLFLIAFVIAALIPVSSLTGGGRYLYLASVGTSLLVGLVCRMLDMRRSAIVPVALVLAISTQQLVVAARAWTWASAMTTDAFSLMTSDLQPCGRRDVLLLTAPVAMRGTYCNFLWEGFGLTSPCMPATFRTLLRVVRDDVHADVSRPAPGTVEVRVPAYSGNILASSDLSTFEVWVAKGESIGVTTPIGRLEARPDGDAEVFRLTTPASLADARLYYYSDGHVSPLRAGR